MYWDKHRKHLNDYNYIKAVGEWMLYFWMRPIECKWIFFSEFLNSFPTNCKSWKHTTALVRFRRYAKSHFIHRFVGSQYTHTTIRFIIAAFNESQFYCTHRWTLNESSHSLSMKTLSRDDFRIYWKRIIFINISISNYRKIGNVAR